jgi:FPC/CPF motif-containing protein YcgG
VSSNPNSKNFSFSIMEEAFFILALHPDSPRLARRFPKPMIVFNPHQQFENLRSVGMYARVRDIIRKKDKLLQGFINPMLNDFGEKSEVFQYTGRMYDKNQPSPLAL